MQAGTQASNSCRQTYGQISQNRIFQTCLSEKLDIENLRPLKCLIRVTRSTIYKNIKAD